jgi:hypothetical protein
MRFAKLAHLDGLVNGLGSWDRALASVFLLFIFSLTLLIAPNSQLPTISSLRQSFDFHAAEEEIGFPK